MIGSIFLVILTAFSLLFIKPSLFARFPHQIKLEETIEVKKKKYSNSSLTPVQKEKYLQQITTITNETHTVF